MEKIVDIKNSNSLQNATQILKKGGILIFPTDTVYGIGCLANDTTVRQLYKIKNRPTNQPTAVLMTKKQFFNYSNINEKETLPKKFWNGKMTIIFNIQNFNFNFPKMILNNSTIGIRLPKFLWLEKLIDLVGPIVASSTNKKGEKPPTHFSEINPQLIQEADLTIKTNKSLLGVSSTIYDLEREITLRY